MSHRLLPTLIAVALLEDACFEGVQGDAALYAPRGSTPDQTGRTP